LIGQKADDVSEDVLKTVTDAVKEDMAATALELQNKPVSEAEHDRMNILRERNVSLSDIGDAMEKEFGKFKTKATIMYHTNPAFRERQLEHSEDARQKLKAEGVDYHDLQSDRSYELVEKRHMLRKKLQVLKAPEEEIRKALGDQHREG
jgi:hypothetical protein